MQMKFYVFNQSTGFLTIAILKSVKFRRKLLHSDQKGDRILSKHPYFPGIVQKSKQLFTRIFHKSPASTSICGLSFSPRGGGRALGARTKKPDRPLEAIRLLGTLLSVMWQPGCLLKTR